MTKDEFVEKYGDFFKLSISAALIAEKIDHISSFRLPSSDEKFIFFDDGIYILSIRYSPSLQNVVTTIPRYRYPHIDKTTNEHVQSYISRFKKQVYSNLFAIYTPENLYHISMKEKIIMLQSYLEKYQ